MDLATLSLNPTFQEALNADKRNSGVFALNKLESLTIEDIMDRQIIRQVDNWIIS